MGRKVNVVLPSGRVVSVDEDVAKTSQLSRDTLGQEAAGVEARSNTEQSSGVVEGLKAFGEGALDTVTFGGYGAVRGAIDPGGASDMRIRAEERSGARFLGEAAAVVAPGLGAAGLLGRAGGAAAKVTAPGLARAAGEVYGGVAGQAVEGALMGAGGYIAETNVTGDPLTIESMVISAGVGGVIDMGLHAAAGKLEGMTWNAKKARAESVVLKDELDVYKKGTKAFQDTPPSWNEFVELHEAKQKSVKAYNAEVRKEAEAYVEHLSPSGLNKVINEFDKARSTVQAEVSRDPAVREALAKQAADQRVYKKAANDYEKLLNDDSAFSQRLNKIQKVLKTKKGEYAPKGQDDLYTRELAGYQGNLTEEGRFYTEESYHTGRKKQPISEGLEGKLKDYNKRLSEIYKKKSGGWSLQGEGKWVKDKSVLPDKEGALADAAQLRADLAQHFGGKTFPNIPMKPAAPADPDVLLNGRAAELAGTSRAIAKGVEDARTLMREGRYEDASLVLADLKAKTGAKVKDLPLPDMPLAPRAPMPEVPVELPKSLDEFARKHSPQIAELAQHVSDPQSQAALYRVMKDLDLKVTGDPVADVTAMHKTLGDYRRTMTKLQEQAAAEKAKAAAKEAKTPGIVKIMNMMVKGTAARAMDFGGALGAVGRVAGREGAGKLMGAVEGHAFGAAMMESRNTIKSRVRNIVAKYGVPTAGAMRSLGPPTAYLKAGFLTGEPDKETDPSRLAVNRIHELQSAAMAAPDAAFLAVQGMLGQPDDVAWKMHQHVVGTLNYLVSTLPRDPGTDTKMFGSNWSPQYHEAIALAHRLEAVQDPMAAITRAIAGDSHPAATEALWAVYPSVMNELAHELSVAAPNMKNLTYEQASAYSNLFRTPLTGLQQPVVVSTLQGMYMTGPQQSAPPPGRPTGGQSKQAPGRPAAVQSPLAGSSPGNLTGR